MGVQPTTTPQPIAAPATPLAGPAFPPDVSALTPDALMTYCQTQVGGLDDQIKSYFDKQQASNAQRAALNDVLATLNANINGFLQDDSPANQATCATLHTQMEKAIATAGGPTTALGAQLAGIEHDMDSTAGDSKMADYEVKAFVDRVKNVQSDITNTSELDMIQLQSLSQKRATALQLCTNLVQSFGDQTKTISANVGH